MAPSPSKPQVLRESNRSWCCSSRTEKLFQDPDFMGTREIAFRVDHAVSWPIPFNFFNLLYSDKCEAAA